MPPRGADEDYAVTLIAALQDGLYVLDADGVHVEVNPALCRMTGFTREELIGAGPPHPYWPPEQTPALAEALTCTEQGPGSSFELTFMRKDGARFPVIVSPSVMRDKQGAVVRCFATVRDISERMRADEMLRHGEERYRQLLENANDAIYVHELSADNLGRFLEANEAACQMLGYTRDELLTMDVGDIDVPEQRDRLSSIIEQLYATGRVSFETEHLARNGHRIPVDVSTRLFDLSGKPTVLSVVRDVSERKRAEEAIGASEARYRSLFETMAQGVIYQAADGRITDINPAAQRILGLSLAQLRGRSSFAPRFYAIHEDGSGFPDEDHPAMEALRTGRAARDVVMGVYNPRADEHTWILVNATPQFRQGEAAPFQVFTTFEDITERQRGEDALRQSEALMHGLFDTMTSGAGIYEVHNDGSRGSDYVVRDFNARSLELEGRPKEEVVGKALSELRPNIDEYGLIPVFQRVWQTGEPAFFPSKLYVDDRYGNYYENRVFKLPTGEIVAIYDDVTERVRAEEELHFTRFAVEHAADTVFWLAPNGAFKYVNRKACQILGYAEDELLSMTIHDVDPDHPPERWADHWRELLKAGSMTFETRHRAKDGRIIPVDLTANYMEFAGQEYNVAFARDTSERKQAEQNAAAAARRLRAALHDTVKALGAIVGLRDPYTAGHERRVTRLAGAIARDLGLEADRCEALALAGEVHDVGKIGVPAEILSKPAALTSVERRLVEQHPRLGSEILADIAFEQPIAMIVRQHHERLDGSGYPDGRAGDEIMLEARILAVADVVEAMASHRPYRPSLGIDAALAEVRQGAGPLFDADVVAACERVVASGFDLEAEAVAVPGQMPNALAAESELRRPPSEHDDVERDTHLVDT